MPGYFCTVLLDALPVPLSPNTDLCVGNFVFVHVRYQTVFY